jgi:putative endonuclease
MRSIGNQWENATLDHLQRAGLTLLARNFSSRYGEIDLVMLDKTARDGGCIVFVEVRYRGNAARGDGAASVGASKRMKLTRTAAVYLQSQPRLAGLACRFDVVACTGTPENPAFDWICAAFDAC